MSTTARGSTSPRRSTTPRHAWWHVTVASTLLLLLSLAVGLTGADGALAQESAGADAGTDPAAGLGGYTAEGLGAPISVHVFEPFVPFPVDPGKPHLQVDLGYVMTDLSTGPQGRALASSVWPGPTIGDGFGTLVEAFAGGGGEETVTYPLKTDVRSPGQVAETCTEAPVGAGMCSYAEGFEARATTSTARSPATEVLGFGIVDGVSRSWVEDGRAIHEVTTGVTGLELLGGLVEIDSVVTRLRTSSDGETADSSGHTTVGGLTIAGQGFTVDEEGLRPTEGETLLDLPGLLPDRTLLLDLLGIEIRLVPHDEEVDGATAVRGAGGVQIRIDLKVLKEALPLPQVAAILQDVPSIGTLLGEAGVPPEVLDQLPQDLFQDPYLTLLPYLSLGPELLVTVASGESRTAGSRPIELDLPAAPAPPPPTSTDGDGSDPGGPSVATPTDPVVAPGSLPSTSGQPRDGLGGPTPVEEPQVAGEVVPPQASPSLASAGGDADEPFGGITPLLGMIGLLGVAVGSWGLRTTSAAVFGAAGACDTGHDESLPDLKGA